MTTTQRQTAREAAAAALTGLSIFQGVYPHALRTLAGQSPLATVTSAGLTLEARTRGGGATLQSARLLLSIYVRCDLGSEATAETRLDDLTTAAAVALEAAGFSVDASNAMPSNAILHNYDGTLYRVERVPLTWET